MEWNITLTPNVPERHYSTRLLQVSHALLISGTAATVTWTCGDQRMELCRLSPSQKEHTNLAMNFMRNDDVFFSAVGDATVMLFGFLPTEASTYNFEYGLNFRLAKMRQEGGQSPTMYAEYDDDNLYEWLMSDHLPDGFSDAGEDYQSSNDYTDGD